MKTIVITGSTRGIGLELGREFLRRNCQVVFSGRSEGSVSAALDLLSKDFSHIDFAGMPCDVKDLNQIQALWDQSVKRFEKIDIWINNAGISNKMAPPWDIPKDEIQSVLETNFLGEIYGSKVAMQGFIKQGYGALYNVEGMGADGKTHNVKGLSIYGATKAGLHFFNKCLADENEHPDIIVGALQPGMVLTEMVRGQYKDNLEEWENVKGVLTLIANPIDDVVTWLVDKILTNQENGAYFRYGSTLRILKRMILLPFRRKNIQ
jgi:NAD(P)-dependent dehydrogenase (short-subunit alcohol dehydrogenase family)